MSCVAPSLFEGFMSVEVAARVEERDSVPPGIRHNTLNIRGLQTWANQSKNYDIPYQIWTEPSINLYFMCYVIVNYTKLGIYVVFVLECELLLGDVRSDFFKTRAKSIPRGWPTV